MAAGPTRRVVLAASAAAVPLLASACRGVQVLGPPPPAAKDVRALQSAIDAERALIASYHAVIAQATTPGEGDKAAAVSLTGLLAEHHQHLAQLSARLVGPAGSAPKQAVPDASAPAAPSAGLTAALGGLADDELAASARLAGQLLAVPPSLAQLMASISASEATHVSVLRSLGRAR